MWGKYDADEGLCPSYLRLASCQWNLCLGKFWKIKVLYIIDLLICVYWLCRSFQESNCYCPKSLVCHRVSSQIKSSCKLLIGLYLQNSVSNAPVQICMKEAAGLCEQKSQLQHYGWAKAWLLFMELRTGVLKEGIIVKRQEYAGNVYLLWALWKTPERTEKKLY